MLLNKHVNLKTFLYMIPGFFLIILCMFLLFLTLSTTLPKLKELQPAFQKKKKKERKHTLHPVWSGKRIRENEH